MAGAWEADGASVLRLERFWEPPSLAPATVRLCGPDTFCLVAAQKLGVRPSSPADELLAAVPAAALKLTLVVQPLSAALGAARRAAGLHRRQILRGLQGVPRRQLALARLRRVAGDLAPTSPRTHTTVLGPSSLRLPASAPASWSPEASTTSSR